jgi:hypothetical protein
MSSLDDTFENLETTIKKLGKSRFEDFFASTYPEQWSVLTAEEKDLKIEKLKSFIESPENKSDLQNLKERLERLKATEFNMAFLFLGVLLGISGNLLANLLDRYFIKYGFGYDLIVGVIFFLSLWYIEKTFIKNQRAELEHDETTTKLLEIVDDFK